MTARRKTPRSVSPSDAVPPPAPPTAARGEGDVQRLLRAQRARRIIRRYMAVSAATALLPNAAFDQLVLGAVLAKLLHELCEVYDTTLAEQKTRVILGAVLGGAHGKWINRYVARYASMAFPTFRFSARFIARPMVASAIIYSIGTLFLQHFETGAWLQKGWKALPKPAPLPSP